MGKKAFWDGLNGPGITDQKSVEILTGTRFPISTARRSTPRADRVEQMALAAAAEAFEHAGRPAVDAARFGTIFATGVGGLRSTQDQIE
jgi:3-oxoacyl-[acyl-carrier-protein] synthase II